MSTRQDFALYAKSKLAPVLRQMVERVLIDKPAKPVEFMIEFLKAHGDSLGQEILDSQIKTMKEVGGEGIDGEVAQLLQKVEELGRDNSALKKISQEMAERLKNERDEARANVQKLESELDSSKNELSTANEAKSKAEEALAAKTAEAEALASEVESLKKQLEESSVSAEKAAVGTEDPKPAAAAGLSAVFVNMDYSAFKQHISEAHSTAGVAKAETPERLVELCDQVLNLVDRRRTSFVVGEEGSGAAQLISTVSAAATSAGLKMNLHQVSVGDDISQLFGNVDEEGNWSDGELVKAIRSAAAAEDSDLQMVCISGDLEMLLLENLQNTLFTVQDVSLPNGETIALPDRLRIVAICEDADDLPEAADSSAVMMENPPADEDEPSGDEPATEAAKEAEGDEAPAPAE